MRSSFQSLIRPLLGKNEQELRRWRDLLREALGPNALLIVELVPELKHIIGEQPPVPPLPPQDAQARFQLVFRRFIGVFVRPEHPWRCSWTTCSGWTLPRSTCSKTC